MGGKSRRKGKRGELEAAAEIRRLFRTEARRGRQFQGSDDSPDVLADIEDVHVEVKRTEVLRLHEALAQAVEDAGERRKRFARRGKSALDLLDELKAELLAADHRRETLSRLQGKLAELTEKSGTPGLDEVLGEIELRVAVELAKRTPKAA